jgi:multiple sugar transport system substrate-binding protein
MKNGKRAGQSSGISRRDMLKATGAAAAVATGAGVGLFGGKAPAFAQAREIHVVAWSHFIPVADSETMPRFAAEFQQATGVKVRLEFINGNDLTPRATAAVESKTGADIFQFQWNQPHVYAAGCEDHDKLAAELGADKMYKFLRDASFVEGKYRAMPYYSIGNAFAYRKDIYSKLSIRDPNTPGIAFTWDDFLAGGKRLKKNGTPVGQALGHSFGDPPTFCYPLLWSFGGREVDEKGKVAINSRETRFSIEFLKELWLAACDEGGLAWDDSANNRAFLGDQIACTLNGASIYFVARHMKAKDYPGLADKIGHFNMPLGPAGRYHAILPFEHSIMSYSKQKEAAADWIRFLHAKKQYEDYILVQKGYGLGATPDWEKHPFWDQDKAVAPFKENAKYGRNFGWPGPFGRGASEVQAKYIIVDMYARAVQGQTADQTIAQAEQDLKQVYERS